MNAAAPAHAIGHQSRRPVWTAAVVSTATFAALLTGFALGLRALDEVPGIVTGLARGVRRVDSLAALEREASRPSSIPAYFPDTLAWPPDMLLVFGGSSTAVSFRHRQAGTTWLLVAARAGTGEIAPQILPPATPLQAESTTVRRLPATVERVLDRNGVAWYQVRWHTSATTHLVRYRGTLDDVMLIANSIDERGR